MTIWSSTARGCTCGVLKAQPFRKPTASPKPVPTSGGKVFRLAGMMSPWEPPLPLRAGLLKSKTKEESLGRSLKRSTAVSARKSCWVRLRVLVLVAFVLSRGYMLAGTARAVDAKMAVVRRVLKYMVMVVIRR